MGGGGREGKWCNKSELCNKLVLEKVMFHVEKSIKIYDWKESWINDKDVLWSQCPNQSYHSIISTLTYWKSDLLGIPDTSFRGLSTLTARSVRRSNSEPTLARILYVHTETNLMSRVTQYFPVAMTHIMSNLSIYQVQ